MIIPSLKAAKFASNYLQIILIAIEHGIALYFDIVSTARKLCNMIISFLYFQDFMHFKKYYILSWDR